MGCCVDRDHNSQTRNEGSVVESGNAKGILEARSKRRWKSLQ